MKHFVVDTNVLLHNPNALYVFEENEVVIPFDVIEELDKFKAGTDDLGRNARAAIRLLDALRRRATSPTACPSRRPAGASASSSRKTRSSAPA
jgi:PhoH-like ATPase